MRVALQWTAAAIALFGATVLPAAGAQAAAAQPAAAQTCATSTSKDPQKTSAATVTICRDRSGTVASVAGTVTDLKPGDHRCARVDISQLWGDLDEGEYVNTTDIACGGTTSFNHTGGWVNYDIQVNVFWVAGGNQG